MSKHLKSVEPGGGIGGGGGVSEREGRWLGVKGGGGEVGVGVRWGGGGGGEVGVGCEDEGKRGTPKVDRDRDIGSRSRPL